MARFTKGQSGNPRGRPKKGSALTDFLRYKLAQPVSEEDRRTRAEQWAEAFIEQATKGDATASRAILDRIDGPVIRDATVTPLETGGVRVTLEWAGHADRD